MTRTQTEYLVTLEVRCKVRATDAMQAKLDATLYVSGAAALIAREVDVEYQGSDVVDCTQEDAHDPH